MKHDLGSTIRKGFVPNCGPNGSGFVTWTAHASATCGTGKVVDGPRPGWSVSFCDTCMVRRSVKVDGLYGGTDATITLQQTGPATFAVYAYVALGGLDDSLNDVIRHDTLDAARADANARYRIVKAASDARKAA